MRGGDDAIPSKPGAHLQLAAGGSAIDKGVVLARINDDFAGGRQLQRLTSAR